MDLEDFSGSTKFFLFGEDYLRMKHFLSPGNFIYAKGKVQKKKYKDDELEFKIHSLELLTDIRSKLAEGLSISVSVKEVNDSLIEQVEEILEKHQGTHQLKFEIYDHLEKLSVNMPSRTKRIALSNEMIEDLEKLEGIEYKIY
jgi:DNA polymerase-3 subunit alpha